VHCAGGRHRTGAMTAVFRMTMQGWDANRAYDEMKNYDFYTRWGHKAMKQFVFDYFRDMSNRKIEDQITVTESVNQ
jgi:tyrosine-protein phosphatase SIW14